MIATVVALRLTDLINLLLDSLVLDLCQRNLILELLLNATDCMPVVEVVIGYLLV